MTSNVVSNTYTLENSYGSRVVVRGAGDRAFCAGGDIRGAANRYGGYVALNSDIREEVDIVGVTGRTENNRQDKAHYDFSENRAQWF